VRIKKYKICRYKVRYRYRFRFKSYHSNDPTMNSTDTLSFNLYISIRMRGGELSARVRPRRTELGDGQEEEVMTALPFWLCINLSLFLFEKPNTNQRSAKFKREYREVPRVPVTKVIFLTSVKSYGFTLISIVISSYSI